MIHHTRAGLPISNTFENDFGMTNQTTYGLGGDAMNTMIPNQPQTTNFNTL